MPLLLPVLENELSKLMDKTNPQFIGFPGNVPDVAENWSNAIYTYSQSIIPPSTTGSTAKNAMKSVLLGATAPGSFFPLFELSFTAFATQLGLGMSGFTAVPPPLPIILMAPMLAIPLSESFNASRITVMASIIDSWFRLGTATPIGGGSPIIWS